METQLAIYRPMGNCWGGGEGTSLELPSPIFALNSSCISDILLYLTRSNDVKVNVSWSVHFIVLWVSKHSAKVAYNSQQSDALIAISKTLWIIIMHKDVWVFAFRLSICTRPCADWAIPTVLFWITWGMRWWKWSESRLISAKSCRTENHRKLIPEVKWLCISCTALHDPIGTHWFRSSFTYSSNYFPFKVVKSSCFNCREVSGTVTHNLQLPNACTKKLSAHIELTIARAQDWRPWFGIFSQAF